jgi:penicillin-binding protein 1C
MSIKRFLKKYAKHTAVITAVCFALIVVRIYPKQSVLHKYSFSKSFFSKDAELLRMNVSHDDKYRIFIPFEEMPQILKDAVLLYEDKYFYYHPGVNPAALAKAFARTFIKKDGRQGASTITMQTARIVYNLNTKTILGKIKQIFLALWLEMKYSKKDIFEAANQAR